MAPKNTNSPSAQGTPSTAAPNMHSAMGAAFKPVPAVVKPAQGGSSPASAAAQSVSTKKQEVPRQGPAAYGVHAPGGGAGQVVVNPNDAGDFPSLGDTSLVGRASGVKAAGVTSNGRAGGVENKAPPLSVQMNPAAAPVFVPVAQPRAFDVNSFRNGMIFKASNTTYGECLQRQVCFHSAMIVSYSEYMPLVAAHVCLEFTMKARTRLWTTRAVHPGCKFESGESWE